MFTLKKTQKKGACAAMRCTEPAADVLCPAHHMEWQEAGSPPLSATPTAAIGALASPLFQAKMDQERERASRCLAMIVHLPSATSGDLEKLGMLVNSCKAMIDRLDAERTDQVRPLNDAVKTINGWAKPPIEFYQSAQRALKSKIAAAMEAQAKARTEALAVIAAGAGSAPAEAFAIAHAPVVGPGNVQLRERVTYEVQDQTKVPDEYWTRTLNYKMIEQAVRNGVDVPGVRRIVETQVAAKS